MEKWEESPGLREMSTLVVVPCGKDKIWDRYPKIGPIPARSAYISELFKSHRKYAERVGDAWIILSAKYGMIPPEFIIQSGYDVTFNDLSSNPVTIETIKGQVDHLPYFDRIIGLGGRKYRGFISAAFFPREVEFPFEGLSLGYLLQAIKKATR